MATAVSSGGQKLLMKLGVEAVATETVVPKLKGYKL